MQSNIFLSQIVLFQEGEQSIEDGIHCVILLVASSYVKTFGSPPYHGLDLTLLFHVDI